MVAKSSLQIHSTEAHGHYSPNIYLKNCGVETTFIDIQDIDAVESAMKHGAKILYTESLSNPTLRTADIAALARIAHDNDAILVVDNTFTPMIFSPIQLGADVIIHSATKFLSGASDVIAGVICCSKSFVEELMDLHLGSLMLLGPTMDSDSCVSLVTSPASPCCKNERAFV